VDRPSHGVISDEAAQLMVAEILVLTTLLDKGARLVLVGDWRQLTAMVRCSILRRAQFERSMMERCAGLEGFSSQRLAECYRSHPSIVAWPSERFYEGALRAAHSSTHFPRPRGICWPEDQRLLFVDVNGREERGRSGSRSNLKEAGYVAELVATLVSSNAFEAGTLGSKVFAVVSPYTEQCRLIESELKERRVSEVKTTTLDSIQGDERDIVIGSLVRSHRSVGFLADVRRRNVLMARGKNAVILVGNARTFYAANDPGGHWRDLIESIHGRNCLVDSSLRPISLDAIRGRNVDAPMQLQNADLEDFIAYVEEQPRAGCEGALENWLAVFTALEVPDQATGTTQEPNNAARDLAFSDSAPHEAGGATQGSGSSSTAVTACAGERQQQRAEQAPVSALRCDVSAWGGDEWSTRWQGRASSDRWEVDRGSSSADWGSADRRSEPNVSYQRGRASVRQTQFQR
jgi:hypothetical protein